MEFDGLGETADNIRKIGERVEKETARILNEVGQPRVAIMKSRTPVKDGHLKGSVRLSPAKRTRQGVEVYWQAGGVTTAYALVQHEDLTFKHTSGQAKYIISVVYEDAVKMRTEIGEAITQLFK
jgi:aspartate-semialdehyde dehydrogenase|tara:strand:+ start:22123 stop:22494 length:372 start_codon:yes stop_codon:yes gene_type:complete